MGLNQSSRKITITNDDTKLITVSNALVERLTQGMTDDSSGSSTHSRAPSQNVPVHQTTYSNLPVNSHTDLSTNYPSDYTISALQIQQEKEKELQDQEFYWQRRMQNMEKNHALINEIFDKEHKKAVDELVNRKGGKDIQGSITPCLQNSEQVLKCYQDHPREILKCADLVEKFSSCVDQRRAQVIAAR